MVIALGAGYAETCKSGSGGGSAETADESQYGAAVPTSQKFGLAEVVGAGPQNITYCILTGGAKGMILTAAYTEIAEVVQATEQTEIHPFIIGERFTAEQYVQDGDPLKWERVRVTYEIVKTSSKTIQLKPIDRDGKVITRKPKKFYNGDWCFSIDDSYTNTFLKAAVVSEAG